MIPGLPTDADQGQYLATDADGCMWLLAWNPDGHCWSAIGFELNHPKPWPKLHQLHGDKAGFIIGHVRGPDPDFVRGHSATAAPSTAGGGAHEPA